MSQLTTRLPTDTWITVPWEKYLEVIENPMYQNSKSYYYRGNLRIEMLPVSFDHGKDHVIIATAVTVFAALKGIRANGLDTTSFRKTGIQECQPDLAYYLGDRAQVIPNGTGIVNLDQYPAPDLVIEIAKTSLLDDIGIKRSLYEALGVKEYWIIDVNTTEIIAYTILNRDLGSQQIRQSQVLSALNLSLLEEALRRSRESNHSEVLAWLMSQFSR